MKAGIWMVVVLMGAMAGEVAAGENKSSLPPLTRSQLPDYILTGCQEMPGMSEPTSAERFVDPIGFLAGYYYENPKREFDPTAASITLLKEPTHGKIFLVTDNVSWPGYRYDAEPGYAGKDQVAFQAQYHSKTYKVVVNLQVSAVESIPDSGSSVCPAPQLIKVNGKPVSGSSK